MPSSVLGTHTQGRIQMFFIEDLHVTIWEVIRWSEIIAIFFSGTINQATTTRHKELWSMIYVMFVFYVHTKKWKVDPSLKEWDASTRMDRCLWGQTVCHWPPNSWDMQLSWIRIKLQIWKKKTSKNSKPSRSKNIKPISRKHRPHRLPHVASIQVMWTSLAIGRNHHWSAKTFAWDFVRVDYGYWYLYSFIIIDKLIFCWYCYWDIYIYINYQLLILILWITVSLQRNPKKLRKPKIFGPSHHGHGLLPSSWKFRMTVFPRRPQFEMLWFGISWSSMHCLDMCSYSMFSDSLARNLKDTRSLRRLYSGMFW